MSISILNDPTFYTTLFSVISLVASEILPFIPSQGNGILHSIFLCLSSYRNQPTIQPITKTVVRHKNTSNNENADV